MDISIIVPVYQVEAWIEECLESLFQQSFQGDYEVILVDDCGKDHSISLAQQRFPQCRVLRHTLNRGLSAARNTGMDSALGKYLLFVDADDRLSRDALQRLFERAEETQAEVTVGAYDLLSESGQRLPFRGEKDLSPLAGQPYVMAWNKLFLRDFLERHHLRFVEGLLHEDHPWSFEVGFCCRSMATVPEVTYHYRVRSGSLQQEADYALHLAAYDRILREYARIVAAHPAALGEFERQKALFFAITCQKGSFSQQCRLYRTIRACRPWPSLSKADCHYYLPLFLGYWLYRKFHKYHLC